MMEMEERLNAFRRVLDPQDNATGGGAASAVAGAMAAALVGMVARVSVGKINMPERDDFYLAVDQAGRRLADELLAGSNMDSEAFDWVMEAYRMPKETAEQKAARSAAIQAAMVRATDVPLQNAARCAQTLDLARTLAGRSNPAAASDLDCAVYLATAGLKGALSNAEINIQSIKDEAIAADFRGRADDLRVKLDNS